MNKLTCNDKFPALLSFKSTNRFDISEFEIIFILGTGAFGAVYLARRISDNLICAIKTLSKANIIKNKQVDHLFNEVNILSSIDFPMIVNLYGIHQDSRYLYLAMEFLPGGELFNYLRKVNKLNFLQASFYSSQIVLIFEYLHSYSIVYRDLKPENILFDS